MTFAAVQVDASLDRRSAARMREAYNSAVSFLANDAAALASGVAKMREDPKRAAKLDELLEAYRATREALAGQIDVLDEVLRRFEEVDSHSAPRPSPSP